MSETLGLKDIQKAAPLVEQAASSFTGVNSFMENLNRSLGYVTNIIAQWNKLTGNPNFAKQFKKKVGVNPQPVSSQIPAAPIPPVQDPSANYQNILIGLDASINFFGDIKLSEFKQRLIENKAMAVNILSGTPRSAPEADTSAEGAEPDTQIESTPPEEIDESVLPSLSKARKEKLDEAVMLPEDQA